MMDAENREKWVQKNALEKGMQQGMKQGLEKGMEKGKAEMALRMLDNGLDEASVVKYSGMTIEQLRKIKEGLDD